MGRALLTTFMLFTLNACAYHAGMVERSLPGGYRQIAIPVFKNFSQEVGIEVAFTNSMIREFEQSQIAEVVPVEKAPLKLEGEINSVKYESRSQATEHENKALPAGSVLTTSYRILVEATIRLRRTTDQTVLWQGKVVNERVYNAPRIGSAVVNSANVLYNQSARNQNITVLAAEMMEEAHDRMTENF